MFFKKAVFILLAFFVVNSFGQERDESLKIEIDLCTKEAVRAVERRAFFLRSAGEEERAIEDYSWIIQNDPTNEKVIFDRGYCYSKLRVFDKAVVDFTKVIELNPQKASAYAMRANVNGFYLRMPPASTLPDLNKALEIDPEYSFALLRRAQCFEKMEEYDKALADYSALVALESSESSKGSIYADIGLVYKKMGKTKDALEYFSKAIELAPSYAESYFHRAEIFREKGEYTKAITDYTKAGELRCMQRQRTLLMRGKCYLFVGDYESAIADFSARLDIPNPFGGESSFEARFYRAVALWLTEKPEEAREDFSKVQKRWVTSLTGDRSTPEKIREAITALQAGK